MKSYAIWILTLACAFTLATSAFAEVPHLINYQGTITDASGPVDGPYDLTFNIYPDTLGDTAIWTEEHYGVEVTYGLFNVILGSINPFPASLFQNNDELWMGTAIDSDPVVPRMRIISVPWALRANVADTAMTMAELPEHSHHSLDAADGDPADAVYVNNEGNVGIGTTPDPNYKLYLYLNSNNWAKLVSPSTGVSGRGLSNGVVGTGGSGVYGYSAWGDGAYPYDDAVGVRGVGCQWGVVGIGNGTCLRPGAGVLGVSEDANTYAGWFKGDVKVEGTGTMSASTSGSVLSVVNNGGGDGIYVEATANEICGGRFKATGIGSEGVHGEANGTGVYGLATCPTGGVGVCGVATGTDGKGVEGIATVTNGIGVKGCGFGYDFYAFGPGTNYGPFTGGHEVKLSKDFPWDAKRGMVVSITGETLARRDKDGRLSVSSTLPTVKLADVANDKAVFGVLVAEGSLPEDHWHRAMESERFATVNALGEGRVWVSNINREIEAGDYITTSSIPGYGQRQDDDLLHSYTLGKAIENVDWDSVKETIRFDGRTVKIYLIAVVYTSG